MNYPNQGTWTEPRDGTVLEIPLAGDYGFAYAKYISQRRHPSLGNLYFLLKAYDYVARTPLPDLTALREQPYALDDLLVSGLVPALAQGRWQAVGQLPVRASDTVPPPYRKQYPRQKQGDYWMRVQGGGTQELPCSREEVRHLRDYVWEPVATVELELSFHFLDRDDVPTERYIDLNDARVRAFLDYQRTGFAW